MKRPTSRAPRRAAAPSDALGVPTTLDILQNRLAAIEARLTVVEFHMANTITVAAGVSDLETALAKLGAAVRQAKRGGTVGNA